MRTLIIDIGNTSVKFGLADGASIVTVTSLPTEPDALHRALIPHLHGFAEDAETCIACSVVPAAEPFVRDAVRTALGIEIGFAHREIPIPLENRYENPTEVGSDRLVAAYAARLLFPDTPALISVDYGTATTFDCVNGHAYLGGLIAPGVFSSLAALAQKTAKLPTIDLREPGTDLHIGRNTVASMNSGFLFGFAGLTEGILARLKRLLPSPCPVVATGGFAKDLSAVIPFDRVEPDLILNGLLALANQAS